MPVYEPHAVFGGIPWQRCQFHLQQNAQAVAVDFFPNMAIIKEEVRSVRVPRR